MRYLGKLRLPHAAIWPAECREPARAWYLCPSGGPEPPLQQEPLNGKVISLHSSSSPQATIGRTAAVRMQVTETHNVECWGLLLQNEKRRQIVRDNFFSQEEEKRKGEKRREEKRGC
ncbi:unnamed protein product [Pleuronectes platessa]|uniref:Uncharacterized protein n=1 Tax=Pleuronectes platessa TaxID=8262 RepID=A0A9N7Z0C2_PLEPL|nr:unnamed protein product [Pleuronectes platessa]